MMSADADRPSHGGATTTNTAAAGLLICFTSRSPSTSLMKHSTKSLYSPGRPGAVESGGSTAASSTSSSVLYTSLSRRMRHSVSLGGGGLASPMFPPPGSGKKKAAAAFEEPSSPKVTCIGQVRVKTGKRMRAAAAGRSRSRRRSDGGGSFRERERQRYWAALPISICEGVRALGAEFNCFQSCGGGGQSWCGSETPSGEKEKTERKRPARSYCGAVFARWLVALDDDEEEVEEKEKEKEKEKEVSHVLSRKLEEGRLERLGEAAVVVEDVEELEGEYEVCVPPKNALLLMRCRSEPFRMASYSNQLWESPANPQIDRGEEGGEVVEEEDQEEETENGNAWLSELKEEIEEKEDEVEVEKKGEDCVDLGVKEEDKAAIFVEFRSESSRRSSVCIEEGAAGHDFDQMIQEEKFEFSEEVVPDHDSSPSQAQKGDNFVMDEQISIETPNNTVYSSESALETIKEEAEQTNQLIEDQEKVVIELGERVDIPPTEEDDGDSKEEEGGNDQDEKDAVAVSQSEEVVASEEEKMSAVEVLASPAPPPATAEEKVKEDDDGALPDCLLLMLYEPKLSMEVSKETWVCSTDFFQWRPGRRTKLAGDTAVPGVVEACRDSTDLRPSKPSSGGVVESRRNSTDSRPSKPSGNRVAAAPSGPPPAPAPSNTSAVEEKLVKAAAYEPLVLTRCKSEPMRTSARLAPEACFWKTGRKLPQPPRRSLRAGPVS